MQLLCSRRLIQGRRSIQVNIAENAEDTSTLTVYSGIALVTTFVDFAEQFVTVDRQAVTVNVCVV
jgi:hypothetical protein